MNRQRGAWNEYVSDQLLNRLFGFELLVAPYAVAHLKLGVELQNTGYEFGTDQRLGIYLTNTLEEAAKRAENLFATWISYEANAAADIKRELPILVVLGNPPYAGHSANRSRIDRELVPGDSYTVIRGGPQKSQRSIVQRIAKKKMRVRELTFIGQLVDDYYFVDDVRIKEKNPKWLQDDYVKFIRFAQWRIERTGYGILAFITNNGYLDNPTFRGMRHSLLQSFGEIHVYNLHGSEKKKEQTPDGGKDQNVFDIRQGVAIILAVRPEGWKGIGRVKHADLWGTRDVKYKTLENTDIDSTDWKEIHPRSPNYFFVPVDQTLASEFEQYPGITEVMPVNVLGFQSHRDHFAISFNEKQIRERVADLRNNNLTDDYIRERYRIVDNRDWNLRAARASVQKDDDWEHAITVCLYRPFDFRYCYFSTVAMDYPRRELLQHVAFQPNLCLGLGRQGLAVNDPLWSLICASTHPIDANVFRRGGVNIFPLWLYPRRSSTQGTLLVDAKRKANFAPDFLAQLAERLNLQQQSDGLPEGVSAENIFEYIYAVLNSKGYRRRYADFLRSDFPRVPIISDIARFRALAEKGRGLLQVTLMKESTLDDFITDFPKQGENIIEDVTYNAEKHRVWINSKQYFERISPEIWDFVIGGYQVSEFWLKERQGRKLVWNDIQHYQRIIVAIERISRIISEIDSLLTFWPPA
jgi:predicted helicase